MGLLRHRDTLTGLSLRRCTVRQLSILPGFLPRLRSLVLPEPEHCVAERCSLGAIAEACPELESLTVSRIEGCVRRVCAPC